MKRLSFVLLSVLVLSGTASALNLTNFYFTPTIKVPADDLWPNVNCTTCTISPNWDGHTAMLTGARGELLTGLLYLANGSGGNATNVSVQISSFTGPGGASIIPVVVSSANVWDSYASGPINLFYMRYLKIKGITQNSWDPAEIDERDLPLRFQRPYTVDGNNRGIPSGLWTDRPDHDKYYPDIMVPYEEIAASSFTVHKSSSQAIGMDIYVSTFTYPGLYTGLLTVKEGVTVSTQIPVQLTVYNFSMPTMPNLRVLGYSDDTQIDLFHYNNEFPSSGDPFRNTRMHYYAMLWRHGIIPIGDNHTNIEYTLGKNYPTYEFQKQLDGSLFNPPYGFGNSPRLNVPVPFYMVGTYGNWATRDGSNNVIWSTATTAGTTGFCTQISSWSANLAAYPSLQRSALYLNDEVDNTTLAQQDEVWATWLSTSCAQSGKSIYSWTTAFWPLTQQYSPHLNMSVTTEFYASGMRSSSFTIAATYYETAGANQAWIYNGHPPSSGTMYATEDDGVSPMVFSVAAFKKGVQGMFLWHVDNWKNSNNTPSAINDLFNDAKTFGGDVCPGTNGNSSVRGCNGSSYSNGDGVLLYPGNDTQDLTNNYGFDGPMPSFRLKKIKDGINLYDYLTMAYAVNPSSTTAIANVLAPTILYEVHCFNDATGVDCGYAYGGRLWNQDPAAWETQRQNLATIIQGGQGPAIEFTTQ